MSFYTRYSLDSGLNQVIKFIFGAQAIPILHSGMSTDDVISILRMDMQPGQDRTIGIVLNPLGEVLDFFGRMFGARNLYRRSFSGYEVLFERENIQIVNTIAVYPSLARPRFCFPAKDSFIHRMLLQDIFLARRYAFSIRNRIALRAYFYVVTLLGNSLLLCPAVYVQLRRC